MESVWKQFKKTLTAFSQKQSLQIYKVLSIQLQFVLKICTDTYKTIDKNISLLTICLGGWTMTQHLGVMRSCNESVDGMRQCYSDFASFVSL